MGQLVIVGAVVEPDLAELLLWSCFTAVVGIISIYSGLCRSTVKATPGGQSDPSAGSAPARLLRLLRAGLTALGGVHSQREWPAHRAQVTASGACASQVAHFPAL